MTFHPRARSDGDLGAAADTPDPDHPYLTVSTSHPAPGTAVVRTVGDVDLLTAPDWARALTDACARLAAPPGPPVPRAPGQTGRPREPRLVCDLSAVEFLGASGLSVLVRTREQADAVGVALRLVIGPSRCVRRALELTGLLRTFDHEPRLSDAVSSTAGNSR